MALQPPSGSTIGIHVALSIRSSLIVISITPVFHVLLQLELVWQPCPPLPHLRVLLRLGRSHFRSLMGKMIDWFGWVTRLEPTLQLLLGISWGRGSHLVTATSLFGAPLSLLVIKLTCGWLLAITYQLRWGYSPIEESQMSCAFCSIRPNSIDHLFFGCSITRGLAAFWAAKFNLP